MVLCNYKNDRRINMSLDLTTRRKIIPNPSYGKIANNTSAVRSVYDHVERSEAFTGVTFCADSGDALSEAKARINEHNIIRTSAGEIAIKQLLLIPDTSTEVTDELYAFPWPPSQDSKVDMDLIQGVLEAATARVPRVPARV